jgi:hypothetical protein
MPGLRRLSLDWWGNLAVTTGPVGTSATWVGIQFGMEVAGRINGVGFYVDMTEDGNYGFVIEDVAARVAVACHAGRVRVTSGNAWQHSWFRPWFRYKLGTLYRLWVNYPHGKYFRRNAYLTGPIVRNNITYENGFQSTLQWPIGSTPTLNSNANALDIFYQPD